MQFFGVPFTVFGDDSLQYLNTILGKRAFIVTDANIVKLGLHELVIAELKAANIECKVFDGVEPDPSIQTVEKATAIAKDFKPDLFIGLGGGSSMDACKSTMVCYCAGIGPLDMSPSDFYNLRAKARLVCIPTTSGTGSEATWAIVLTDVEGQRKVALGSYETLPDVAILDPRMVMSMPPSVTGSTGMDALTHAVEGYTATWRTPFTDGPGLIAIKYIFENLKKAVDNGKDEEARKYMMYAASQAGTCFGNGMAGLAHSCGHALGGIFHTPHGVAMGLYLPYTMEYEANGSEETLQRYAEIARFCGIAQGSDKECCKALIGAVRKLVKDVGQSPSVKELKIDKDKFMKALPDLVDRAVNEAMTIAVTRVPESEDLEKMFICAYDGKPVDF
ncbi:MAG: iron-containing alcohol dehydrogenase [Dehalococcoidia bacterium]|nr:iron-containing alcohol dehydrogenase [Dehalococcoidia bacterium]